MQRKNILKQINAIQKSLDDLEKGRRKRWPTSPPSRLKDTKEDRERPIETPPDVPKKPPYNPMEDVGKAEGDTAPATESTQAAADKARRLNEAAQDRQSVPEEPIIQRKPPYKMEYQEEDYPVNDETTPWTPSPKKDERADDDIDDDPTRGIDYSIDKGAGSSDYRGAREGTPDYIKNRDKSKAEIGRGDIKRKGPERVRVVNKPVEEKPEENFDMMRKAIETSLLKLMQYGGN